MTKTRELSNSVNPYGISASWLKDGEIANSKISDQAEIISEKLSFIQSSNNAVTRTVASKLADVVCVRDFIPEGTDTTTTDCTPFFQAAIDSLGETGGIVTVENDGKYYLGTTLVLRVKTFIVGNAKMPGMQQQFASNIPTTDYSKAGSSLRLSGSATIEVGRGAGLEGLLIYRQGMVFPATPATTTQGWTGTAVTITGVDASVMRCMIMGFNKGIYCSGYGRLRVEYLFHDNFNGIEIADAGDIPYITHCHAWPWATICFQSVWPNLIRPGICYYLHDFVDWCRITECFCWGWDVGFKIEDVNSTILTNCGADNPWNSNAGSLYAGSKGFVIESTSFDTKLVNCQAAAQGDTGLYIDTPIGDLYTTQVDGFTSWYCAESGIHINSGNVAISNGMIRATKTGIRVSETQYSRINVLGVSFTQINFESIKADADCGNIVLANNIFPEGNYAGGGYPTNVNVKARTKASANPLILPMIGEVFKITGTTSFGSLDWGWLGRRVTLIFVGALTVSHGTGSRNSIYLAGASNFVTSPGSTLSLVHNGEQWYEVSRSN